MIHSNILEKIIIHLELARKHIKDAFSYDVLDPMIGVDFDNQINNLVTYTKINGGKDATDDRRK